ncbi:headcase protein-like [Diaphorina citri]|uniref:Headcase protein-like n=1 Tax=Diaphorina citri TaxID=121845 RepID=A0A3Q0IVH6_DIACI|nr:headcase protein-like [Diaphorina citri]
MEDEGNHGNDETRCFILSTLAAHNSPKVVCLLCQSTLPVYDRYPLVDGTFFLSPRQHSKHCFECNNCQKSLVSSFQKMPFYSD